VFGHGPVNWIIGTGHDASPTGFSGCGKGVLRLNVRLNVNITRIERSATGVQIEMEYPEQI